MRRCLVWCGCLLIIAGVFGELLLTSADSPQSPTIPENKVLMRAKLSSSQKVLEGLVGRGLYADRTRCTRDEEESARRQNGLDLATRCTNISQPSFVASASN